MTRTRQDYEKQNSELWDRLSTTDSTYTKTVPASWGGQITTINAHYQIRKMTEQFLTWDKKDASDLHGIGKYGSDSYQIFFMDKIPPNVQDKELKKYIDNLIG